MFEDAMILNLLQYENCKFFEQLKGYEVGDVLRYARARRRPASEKVTMRG